MCGTYTPSTSMVTDRKKKIRTKKKLEVVYLLYEKRYIKLSMKHNKDFLTNFCL